MSGSRGGSWDTNSQEVLEECEPGEAIASSQTEDIFSGVTLLLWAPEDQPISRESQTHPYLGACYVRLAICLPFHLKKKKHMWLQIFFEKENCA